MRVRQNRRGGEGDPTFISLVVTLERGGVNTLVSVPCTDETFPKNTASTQHTKLVSQKYEPSGAIFYMS